VLRVLPAIETHWSISVGAMAIWPRAQSTVSGWALPRSEEPVGNSSVPDGYVADEVMKRLAGEYLRNQAHAFV